MLTNNQKISEYDTIEARRWGVSKSKGNYRNFLEKLLAVHVF